MATVPAPNMTPPASTLYVHPETDFQARPTQPPAHRAASTSTTHGGADALIVNSGSPGAHAQSAGASGNVPYSAPGTVALSPASSRSSLGRGEGDQLLPSGAVATRRTCPAFPDLSSFKGKFGDAALFALSSTVAELSRTGRLPGVAAAALASVIEQEFKYGGDAHVSASLSGMINLTADAGSESAPVQFSPNFLLPRVAGHSSLGSMLNLSKETLGKIAGIAVPLSLALHKGGLRLAAKATAMQEQRIREEMSRAPYGPQPWHAPLAIHAAEIGGEGVVLAGEIGFWLGWLLVGLKTILESCTEDPTFTANLPFGVNAIANFVMDFVGNVTMDMNLAANAHAHVEGAFGPVDDTSMISGSGAMSKISAIITFSFMMMILGNLIMYWGQGSRLENKLAKGSHDDDGDDHATA